MEAFRRIDIERRYPKYSKFGGRFNVCFENEHEMSDNEVLHSGENADKRIKDLDESLDKAFRARISESVKLEPQKPVRKAKGGVDGGGAGSH